MAAAVDAAVGAAAAGHVASWSVPAAAAASAASLRSRCSKVGCWAEVACPPAAAARAGRAERVERVERAGRYASAASTASAAAAAWSIASLGGELGAAHRLTIHLLTVNETRITVNHQHKSLNFAPSPSGQPEM